MRPSISGTLAGRRGDSINRGSIARVQSCSGYYRSTRVASVRTQRTHFERTNYLAGGFDGFAKGPAAGLAVEDVCDEEILRGVHYESALFHVLTDAQE